MGKDGRAFVFKVVLFSILFIGIDQAGGRLLEYFFYRHNPPEYVRMTYALNQANEDAIIFGSSRAGHHYVPRVLQDSLGLRWLNTGKDAHYISYANALLTSILQRTKPKTVILDVNPFEFERPASEDITVLLPYLGQHPELQPLINASGANEEIKSLSRLYRFNSLPLSIVASNLNPAVADDSLHGYIPLHNKWKKKIAKSIDPPGAELDPAAVIAFRQFTRRCKNAGINLIAIASPQFVTRTEPSRSLKIAKLVCSQEGVPYYDFSADPEFMARQDYFADRNHLNDDGAVAFTHKVIGILRRQTRP